MCVTGYNEIMQEVPRCRSVLAVVSPAQYSPPQLLNALRQLGALPSPPVVVLLQVHIHSRLYTIYLPTPLGFLIATSSRTFTMSISFYSFSLCYVYVNILSSSYPFPALSGIGTTCCDKDSAIMFTTGRLPYVNPPRKWSGC
jgi:hypothetical protein